MKNIYLIDCKDDLKNLINKLFTREEVKVKKFMPANYKDIFKKVPDMIIINEDNLQRKDSFVITEEITNDEEAEIVPIIFTSSNLDLDHKIEILKRGVDLYIDKPINEKILYYYIRNFTKLLNSNRTVSPLTGLPGNVQIQAELKNRMKNKEDFSMIYFDLDNFKEYNDTYGFANGDEIIKFTGKVITDNVYKSEDEDDSSFVGHIGGDDFVAIVSNDIAEDVCQKVVAEFDRKVVNYYSKKDIDRGYIEIENRKGILEQFPIVSISIAVVEVSPDRFKNHLEVGEAGANVKHLAKSIAGSTYVIDRRKKREKVFDKAEKTKKTIKNTKEKEKKSKTTKKVTAKKEVITKKKTAVKTKKTDTKSKNKK